MDSTSQKREQHQRVRALFEAALAQPGPQRIDYIKTHSGGHAEVEREVVKLLASVQSANQDEFLKTPAFKRPPAEANVQTGMQFGPYKVIRRLDAGGMGSVYLVARSDDAFQRLAALKIIRPDSVTDDLLRRFQQERQILANLDHPNIARILDGGTATVGNNVVGNNVVGNNKDSLPYFVMDYVEGSHLDAFCAQTRANVEARLRVFIQVCHAVEYLHRNRVIHRDLKPSNILVTKNGTAKLVDFGIAKVMSSAGDSTRTAPLMTPGYASPEQLLGEPVGPRGDVYSLGVILYEVLTGSKPYANTDGNIQRMIAAVTTSEPAPPSTQAGTNPAHVSAENPEQLKRRLTGDLDNVLLMALRREPSRRYATAGDLASDLQNYLEGRPVMARRDAITYRAGKFARRHWMAVAGSVVAVGLLGWGINQRSERVKLEERVRQLENTARRETVRAQARQAAIQEEINQEFRAANPGKTPDLSQIQGTREMYQQQIQDVQQMGQIFRDSLSEAIRLLPGMTAERNQLLTQAASYLDGAAQVAGRDPASRVALGQAYLVLGDLRGYPQAPNLNDRTGALALYERARGLLESQAGDPGVGRLIGQVESHVQAVHPAH